MKGMRQNKLESGSTAGAGPSCEKGINGYESEAEITWDSDNGDSDGTGYTSL